MFRKETEFQETEIGDFPKDWEVRRLNEIAELQRGLSYSGREKSKDEIPDGYLFLTLNSIKEGGGLKENGWTWIKSNKLKERHFVKEGDLVIANTEQSKDGSLIGSPAIVHFPEWYKKDKAVFSMDLSKLLLKVSNVDVNYLFYYLSFVQPIARKYHTGTNVWHLNLDSWAKDLLIPLPPLDEQKRIAGVLSMIDSGIETVDKAIAKLERMKKTLLNKLLTGRIRVREENGKLTFYKESEFQDTEIGKTPKEWEIKRLGELLVFGHGKRPSELLPKGIVPVFGAGGLYGYTNTYMIDKPYVLILARVGVGSVGKVYLARGRVWVTDNAIYAYSRQTESVTAYVYYWLQFNRKLIEKHVKRSAGGYAILTLASLKNITIALPPQNEQKNIVETLNAVNNIIEIYEKEKERLLRVKKGLMGLLLTGKIRVVDSKIDKSYE